MNSGITSRAAIARSSACRIVTKLAASTPAVGKSYSRPAGASRIVPGPYCEKCRVRPVAALVAVASAPAATNCSTPLRLTPRCLRMRAIADWISATTLMFRSSFSARRRFFRTGV